VDEELFHVRLKDAERVDVAERNVSSTGFADDHQRVADRFVIALQDEVIVAALKRPGGGLHATNISAIRDGKSLRLQSAG
jgi:hypothetical protein